jgi:hypothetical protein
MLAAVRLSSGPLETSGVAVPMDPAIRASSGPAVERDPTLAATLLSSGPPSVRALGIDAVAIPAGAT